MLNKFQFKFWEFQDLSKIYITCKYIYIIIINIRYMFIKLLADKLLSLSRKYILHFTYILFLICYIIYNWCKKFYSK